MSRLALASLAARLALPALVLGGVLIGASPIFVRLSELGPVSTAFHRMLWALPLLWLWMRLERRLSGSRPSPPPLGPREHRRLALAGLAFVGDLLFWHWAILHTTVANATLFANFSTIVVALGAWALLGERITGGFLAGLALALAGAGLLMGGSLRVDHEHLLGDGLGLVTACFFGAYVLVVSRLRTRLSAAVVMYWSGLTTCAGLLAASLLAGESLWPETIDGLLMLVALAWSSQVLGQGLIGYALGYLPASLSSLVILIEPLAAALLGWAVLAEALGPLQALGGALVLAGILLARRASAPRPQA